MSLENVARRRAVLKRLDNAVHIIRSATATEKMRGQREGIENQLAKSLRINNKKSFKTDLIRKANAVKADT